MYWKSHYILRWKVIRRFKPLYYRLLPFLLNLAPALLFASGFITSAVKFNLWRRTYAPFVHVLFWTLDIDSATAALNLVNGYLFKGKPIIIEYGKQKKESSHESVTTSNASQASTSKW